MILNFKPQFVGPVLRGLYADADAWHEYANAKTFRGLARSRRDEILSWYDSEPDRGPKRCTIRANRADLYQWPRGSSLQFCTGPRMRPVLLGEAKVADSGSICITSTERQVVLSPFVMPDQLEREDIYFLSPKGIEDLARLDGFLSTEEFFAFFNKVHPGRMVAGHLITW